MGAAEYAGPSKERFGAELRRFGVEHEGERLRVVSPYEPAGDQPQAIQQLAEGVEEGLRYQTLMGVTAENFSSSTSNFFISFTTDFCSCVINFCSSELKLIEICSLFLLLEKFVVVCAADTLIVLPKTIVSNPINAYCFFIFSPILLIY